MEFDKRPFNSFHDIRNLVVCKDPKMSRDSSLNNSMMFHGPYNDLLNGWSILDKNNKVLHH